MSQIDTALEKRIYHCAHKCVDRFEMQFVRESINAFLAVHRHREEIWLSDTQQLLNEEGEKTVDDILKMPTLKSAKGAIAILFAAYSALAKPHDDYAKLGPIELPANRRATEHELEDVSLWNVIIHEIRSGHQNGELSEETISVLEVAVETIESITQIRNLGAVVDGHTSLRENANVGEIPRHEVREAMAKPNSDENATVKSHGDIESTAQDKDSPPAIAESKSGSVLLFDRSLAPIVNGNVQPKLTIAQYDVVLALLKAPDKGLTKDQLDENSKHGDARKILKRLSTKNSDWNTVISLAGETGMGYRIT